MKMYTARTFNNKYQLTDTEKAYISQWRMEKTALAIQTESGFILWHTTDFDPEGVPMCSKRLLIDFIFVDERDRRQGHGTILIEAVKKRCKSDQGLLAITANDEAEAFFLCFGFENSGAHADTSGIVDIVW